MFSGGDSSCMRAAAVDLESAEKVLFVKISETWGEMQRETVKCYDEK